MAALAPCFASELQNLSGWRTSVVPRWMVANAIGAALAKTTCDVTLFADTQQEIAIAPSENYHEKISKRFTRDQAITIAEDLVRRKAIERGADPTHFESEIIESQQFNMIRGFNNTGKNIRVTAQVKPGLIYNYQNIIEQL